ncbi:hypothetical protein [Arthrobacter sp. AD-310]
MEITDIESLPPDPSVAGRLVEVTFACTSCGVSYTQQADVKEVARILNRPGTTPNVLVFGGHYVHCGQAMRTAGGEMRTISSERHLPEMLGVYLATRVLRCDCGFQLEIPDAGVPG